MIAEPLCTARFGQIQQFVDQRVDTRPLLGGELRHDGSITQAVYKFNFARRARIRQLPTGRT